MGHTIRAVNPMVAVNPDLRKTILRERGEARRNPGQRAAFEAYRLNRQVNVTHEMLAVDGRSLEACRGAARAGPRGPSGRWLRRGRRAIMERRVVPVAERAG